ncbi:hypothetical protein K438DRAFT_1982468 [Mycena galopus ATCC 62051]|nr:hypothetical protein K438DRAFT_1982468 [Mycena galopus ATCC 62051]
MSATAAPRQRVIDDTDPSIQYGPNGWFVADPSTLTGGNFGSIYQDTSHATTSSSNLTFAFNGTGIEVFGTIRVSTDSATNVTDPTWNCFVDGIPISNGNPTFPYFENNWPLCGPVDMTDGAHVLTIQVQSKGQPFYFDYLTYTPPRTPFLTRRFCSSRTRILLSILVPDGVSLYFHGTAVSPYGFVPTELPHNATWATYAIDGGPPVNFTLEGLSSPSSATEYFYTLFSTPTISSAPHNLVISYGGDSQHTPLVIQGFYITNTSSASADSSNPSSSSPSSSATPTSNPSKSSPAGAIAGGVVGGILLLALLAGLVLYCKRRRRPRGPELTSATPYPMSSAASGAPPFAGASGNPYTYAAVPANSNPLQSQSPSHPSPHLATAAPVAASNSSSGVRTEDSRPSTTYPYIHRAAPLHHHPSDALSTSNSNSRGTPTHTHQLSTSTDSAPQHFSSSTSAVVSHDSGHVDPSGRVLPIVTPAATPSKLAHDRAAPAPTRSTDHPRGMVVVMHEDSGVRLPRPDLEPERIVELPPGYSPD